ncbi:hypothetical protein TPDSL_34140 [Terrisporobacter petrolearius]|uniref:Uncharacterized protein n=1 Tax=Terrisporobacter hibernicus TaxID=2813371 RepID=A0AAX2ZCF1_9FIRM|nr:hypothetical protein [Terrisporobacter hibernicus]UEL46481.1 hypothetical protein JW646_12600 [Terrisporobacter hibernicus]SFI94647.1 hypothetical protein SAMN02910355_0248 [Terrisporobacter glycolicus]
MKKVDPKTLEKFAKEKNIDKNKVEKIAEGYKGKSEDELIDELVKIGKNLKGKDEVVSKFKNFLDPKQQEKLDTIMNKITDAEVQEKVKKNTKKTKSINKNNNTQVEESTPATKKKVKKVKRVKKSSRDSSSNN